MHNQSDKRTFARYRKAVAFVESFSNSSIKKDYRKDLDSGIPGKKDFGFFLSRTRYFLDLLGSPDEGFKYVHITGTAGKGSVSTMVQEILTAGKKKTGLYTSPYVTATIEKIKVGDKYISPKDFTEIVESLKPAIKRAEKGPYGAPSAFELCLAIAILYFKKEKCEWVVLEVGLGGRYDATNMIRGQKIAAITTIDYDHTEILGNTLEKIAYDKAGIIQKGSDFFTSEQRPKLLSLFKKICKQQEATFCHIGKQKGYKKYNEMLARKIAESIGVNSRAIEQGIKKTKLPCRFEIIDTKPTIILDGAHNRAKIHSTIGNLKKISYSKLIVIVAISDTKKDNRAILSPLTKVADHIIVTSLSGSDRKSVHPKALLPYIKRTSSKIPVEVVMEPVEALKLARKLAGKGDCILATGSFFLAGELRKEWYPEEWVLKNRRSFK